MLTGSPVNWPLAAFPGSPLAKPSHTAHQPALPALPSASQSIEYQTYIHTVLPLLFSFNTSSTSCYTHIYVHT